MYTGQNHNTYALRKDCNDTQTFLNSLFSGFQLIWVSECLVTNSNHYFEIAINLIVSRQTQLGGLYTAEENRDWTKASRWFERAAEQNVRKHFRIL